jgi:hypothetical protein
MPRGEGRSRFDDRRTAGSRLDAGQCFVRDWASPASYGCGAGPRGSCSPGIPSCAAGDGFLASPTAKTLPLGSMYGAPSTINGHAGGVLAAGVEFFQERSGCRHQRDLAVGRFGPGRDVGSVFDAPPVDADQISHLGCPPFGRSSTGSEWMRSTPMSVASSEPTGGARSGRWERSAHRPRRLPCSIGPAVARVARQAGHRARAAEQARVSAVWAQAIRKPSADWRALSADGARADGSMDTQVKRGGRYFRKVPDARHDRMQDHS